MHVYIYTHIYTYVIICQYHSISINLYQSLQLLTRFLLGLLSLLPAGSFALGFFLHLEPTATVIQANPTNPTLRPSVTKTCLFEEFLMVRAIPRRFFGQRVSVSRQVLQGRIQIRSLAADLLSLPLGQDPQKCNKRSFQAHKLPYTTSLTQSKEFEEEKYIASTFAAISICINHLRYLF